MSPDNLKPSVVKTSIEELSKKPSIEEQRQRVIGEWLCRFAAVIRDAWGQPAQVDAVTIEAYEAFLTDCKLEYLGEAMQMAGARAKNFPRPEQIREAYFLVLERKAGRVPVCNQCGGCGWVQGLHGFIPCSICSPGAGGNGK